MLFQLKRHLPSTLILTIALGAISLLLRPSLNLSWNLEWNDQTWPALVFWFVVLVIGDGIVQGILFLLHRKSYPARFQEFLSTIVVGDANVILIVALTAAMEEMLYRGILLELMLNRLGWGLVLSVVFATYLFSLSHLIQTRNVATFLLVSVWEGLLLGTAYAMTGSLLVVMILHAVHDVTNGGAAIMLVRHFQGKEEKEGQRLSPISSPNPLTN